eukprot:6111496-Prorocentrum_lima.AAC.1
MVLQRVRLQLLVHVGGRAGPRHVPQVRARLRLLADEAGVRVHVDVGGDNDNSAKGGNDAESLAESFPRTFAGSFEGNVS